jgi:DNA-binding transcriptional LysR family regulator
MNGSRAFAPSMRQLRAFVAVYRLRKIGTAAEQLHLTQSAVSLLVRQLEIGLGITLFERTTRSLRPTEAANDMIAVAERILRDVEHLSTHALDVSALRRGRVSVAVTPTLGAIVLPAAVRAFRSRHPGVQISVDDCAPDQFVSRIVGEQVDFGIGSPEQASAEVDIKTLMRDHLSIVCPTDHPLARQKSVKWSELGAHGIITVRPGYGIRPLIDANAARAHIQLHVVNEVTFLSTALWMTESGMGLSIMPSAYASHSPIQGLAVRPLSHPKVSRDIALVTKRGHTLSPAAHAFVQFVRQTIGPHRTAKATQSAARSR